MKVGLIRLLQEDKHPAPPGHPENPARMKKALDALLDSDIGICLVELHPGKPELSPVFRIHDTAYLDSVKEVAARGGGHLDADTYMSAGSYDAAMETAGAVIWAADEIMQGHYRRIFVAARPPGHHAERNRAMGFCIINNVAVAAESLVVNHNLERIAIVDWDVHHGNGTQHSFYDRRDVYYFSLHQFPFYPGSGASSERGEGKGEGFTLNVPMAAGTDEETYVNSFKRIIMPELEKYQPQFIIISAGFDAHREDPLASLQLTEETYSLLTSMLADIADRFSRGRILSVMEGGYEPEANTRSIYNHLKELIEK
jgi:acetoin utilization deacetylase AcuC-like enzyme